MAISQPSIDPSLSIHSKLTFGYRGFYYHSVLHLYLWCCNLCELPSVILDKDIKNIITNFAGTTHTLEHV